MKTSPPRRPRLPEPPRRRWLGAAALLLAAGPRLARAQPFDLQALAALLRQKRSAEAVFTEERFVSGLDHPLRASGTLSFSAPDRFARHTLKPRPESMIVDGNDLILQRGGRTRQMTVDASPELAALVAAMRGTFNGDLQTLHRFFRISLSGDAQAWRLSLVPQIGGMGSQVMEMVISGRGGDLRTLELLLTGGDRSLMQIEPVPAQPATDSKPR